MADFKLKSVRISYPNLFVPTKFGDNKKGNDDNDDDKKKDKKKKYNCNFLIPKSDKLQVSIIKKAILKAEKEALADSRKWNGKAPRKYDSPLRDGDDKEEPGEFEDHWYINAKSSSKPQVVRKVGKQMVVIDDPEEVYPGAYVTVTLNVYGFDYEGKKGMAAGLGNVLFVKDGERLGAGRTDAEDDFADELDEDDDDEDIDDLL